MVFRRIAVLMFLGCCGAVVAATHEVSFPLGPGGVVWQDRVLPLPQEMVIAESLRLPAGAIRFEIAGAEPDALPLETARQRLASFARGGADAEGLIIALVDRAAAAGRVPDALLERLAVLPNADQAYLIVSDPGDANTPARLTLVGNTPVGMFYAASTLNQLVMPPDDADDAMLLTIPLVDIVDWPDIELRGEWGGAPVWNLDWYANWKLNMYKIRSHSNVSEIGMPRDFSMGGHAVVNLNRFVAYAGSQAFNLIPYIGHVGEIRNWIDSGKFQLALDAEGKAKPWGFCWSQPEMVMFVSHHIQQAAEILGDVCRDVEVWITEHGDISCHCEACGGENGYVMEARGVIAAWQDARQRFPDLRLMVMLSQGSRQYDANDAIIRQAQTDEAIGVAYYDGHLTYVTDRNPMIFAELEEFARTGGRVDVVPHFVSHFGAPIPASMPQFMQFRLREFAKKKLVSVTAFMERDRRYYEMNLAGLGEFAWNAQGRSPHAFARAFAVANRVGVDPEIFARWAIPAGEAAWELATTGFMHNLSGGSYSRLPRIEDEDRFSAAVADAGSALERAIQSGNAEMILESEVTHDALAALVAMREIQDLLRTGSDGVRISAILRNLDNLAHRVWENLYRWEAHGAERIRTEALDRQDWYWIHPLWNLGSTGISPRLRSTAFGLIRAVDALAEQAALMGIDDPRGEQAPVEIGEWTPDLFDAEGHATLEADLTAQVPESGGDLILGFHYLMGAYVRFSETTWSEPLLSVMTEDPASGDRTPVSITVNPYLLSFGNRDSIRNTWMRIPPRDANLRVVLIVEIRGGDDGANGYVTARTAPEPSVRTVSTPVSIP